MAEKLLSLYQESKVNGEDDEQTLTRIYDELLRINDKKNFFHYFDIRTNHLNEKDWRRSFSINQLLYGMILYTSETGDFESFENIMERLEELYKND